MLGGVIGAQLGSFVGACLRGEQLRSLLARSCSWCAPSWHDLVVKPEDLYSLGAVGRD